MELEHLKQKVQEAQNKISQHWLYESILLWIKDPLPDEINVEEVIDFIERYVPAKLSLNLEMISIGKFKELEERNIDALYLNDEIFVTNRQMSSGDLIDDIVHEMAHAAEEQYHNLIYDDGQIAQEFLSKRETLARILEAHNYPVNKKLFQQVEYNPEFDKLLYQKIGYEKLHNLSSGLFLSPYAITSLREYWADAFEDFYIKRIPHKIRKTCPALYEKLIEVADQ